ncbi:hypothetical protein D3C86_1742700 [compost metagenome]
MTVDALAKGGGFAVDLDPAFADPGLDITARGQPHAGQDLLQLFPCGAVFDFTHWAPPGVAVKRPRIIRGQWDSG